MASQYETEDARSRDRTRVILNGSLITNDGLRSVRVRDYSSTGVRIITDALIPLGSDVIFKRGEIFAAAQVVWSESKGAGLRFYRQLEESQLQRF